jgi:hypothetical protein
MRNGLKTLFTDRFEDFFHTSRHYRKACQHGYGVTFHSADSFVHESASLDGFNSSRALPQASVGQLTLEFGESLLWNYETAGQTACVQELTSGQAQRFSSKSH